MELTKEEVRARILGSKDQGGTQIGWQVGWGLHGIEPHEAWLKSTWVNQGLDVGLLPEPITSDKALKEAVASVRTGLAKVDLEFRKAKEMEINGGKCLFVELAHVNFDARARATELDQAATFHVLSGRPAADMPSVIGNITNPTPEVQDVANRLQTAYLHYLDHYPTDDLMKLIVKTLKSIDAFFIYDGPPYFVHVAQTDTLRKLANVISNAAATHSEPAFMDMAEVMDTPGMVQAVSRSGQRSLEKDLSDLVKELGEFVHKGARQDTLDRRLADYQALREKGEFYKTVLSVQVDGLDKGLGEMEGIVQKMISRIKT